MNVWKILDPHIEILNPVCFKWMILKYRMYLSLNNCESHWFIGNHIPLEDAKSHLHYNSEWHRLVLCDKECQSTINIRFHWKTKQMLEGATRNKRNIYEIEDECSLE